MDDFSSISLLSLAMLVGCYVAGTIPLAVNFSEVSPWHPKLFNKRSRLAHFGSLWHLVRGDLIPSSAFSIRRIGDWISDEISESKLSSLAPDDDDLCCLCRRGWSWWLCWEQGCCVGLHLLSSFLRVSTRFMKKSSKVLQGFCVLMLTNSSSSSTGGRQRCMSIHANMLKLSLKEYR